MLNISKRSNLQANFSDWWLWHLLWIPSNHDDVIKWEHFPLYWPFMRGIHWSPVNSRHKGQWRGALKFSLICVWINGWVNNREAGDLRCHRSHYNITVMWMSLNFTDDKSTPVLVMAWCHQATSHYLSQCWPRSILPYGVTKPQWVNSSRPSDAIHPD